MSQPIIVFDLDGTLVDTAPDLLDSLNHSLAAGGASLTDTAGFRQFVGHGGRVMIERAYKAQQRTLAADEHDRLFDLFLDHYGANIPGRSQPYPGVVEALDALRSGRLPAGRLHQQDRSLLASAARRRSASTGISPRSAARTRSPSASPTRAI